jgi:hypothetical protein
VFGRFIGNQSMIRKSGHRFSTISCSIKRWSRTMRPSMAYFAGAGTVIAAIGIGLGGGLTIANVMSPHQEKFEQTRLEQRMSAKPIPRSAEADQTRPQADQPKQQAEHVDGPVPYVAGTGAAVTANAPASGEQPRQVLAAPAPQSSPAPVKEAPVREQAGNDQPSKSAKADKADKTDKSEKTDSTKPQHREQASSSPDDDNAKARPEDANAKARDTDVKRLAAEKRKAERRQQWAERQKAKQQRDAGQRDSDVAIRRNGDGARVVINEDDDSDRSGGFFGRRADSDRRGDSNRRGVVVERRDDSDRPAPFGLPRFNLFGEDRD